MSPAVGLRKHGDTLSSTFVRGPTINQGHAQAAETAEGRAEHQGGPRAGACILTRNNIGFQLLKKSGWKEGSGLGAAEQGIVAPVEPRIKTGREGIGSSKDDTQNIYVASTRPPPNLQNLKKGKEKQEKRSKRSRKRAREALEEQTRMTVVQQEIDFRREFWPDNV